MKGLVVATAILVALLVPAAVGLAGTGRQYLATARDIASIRVAVVSLRPPPARPAGYQRANPGPDVTLRLAGVEQTALTLAEMNFDLTWRGTRLGTASTLLSVPLPRGGSATVTVETNLEPNQADQARELLARGDPELLLIGRARVVLPNRGGGVWLDLRGRLPALAAARPAWCLL